MNKKSTLWLALVAGLVAIPSAGAEELEAGAKLRVTTSNAVLRDSPQPFGARLLRQLSLGDTVVFKERKGAWLRVEHGGIAGFVAANSVAEAKQFSASSLVSRVSDSDLAAATKGFSPEIEERNRKANAELRYDLMDAAEKMSHVADPLQATAAFRKEGLLGEFRPEEKP